MCSAVPYGTALLISAVMGLGKREILFEFVLVEVGGLCYNIG